MTDLTIALPEAMKDYVDRQVSSGVYHTADEFLTALIEQEQERQANTESQCYITIHSPKK